MNLAAFAKRVEKYTVDNAPAILTGIGITGTIATAYLTGKASYEAAIIIEDRDVRPEPKEMVKLTWRLYVPAVTTGLLTVGAIFASNHVSSRRATAMATAYSLSERAFTEYREKIVEKLGEHKEREYREEVAQDRINRNPPNDAEVIITDGGEVLCYDSFSGRYFKSSMTDLKHAENEINHLILHQGYASVSDLYEIIGLPVTRYSEEVGWNIDYRLNMQFSTVLSPDGRPCISIDFDLHPHRKYSHFAE